ncbi:MAG: hypothetical protein KDB27_24005 [Planctomycetales bacterium]|nr:hypothetical protein [Planctomycetales bacterium]
MKMTAPTSLATIVVLVLGSSAVGDASDPTIPSKAITERLQTTATSSLAQHVENKLLTVPLQIKAIILKDRDHGTALLSDGDSKLIVVKLRRSSLGTWRARFAVHGSEYEIRDFSESAIVVYSLTTKRMFTIN